MDFNVKSDAQKREETKKIALLVQKINNSGHCTNEELIQLSSIMGMIFPSPHETLHIDIQKIVFKEMLPYIGDQNDFLIKEMADEVQKGFEEIEKTRKFERNIRRFYDQDSM